MKDKLNAKPLSQYTKVCESFKFVPYCTFVYFAQA